MPTDLGLEWVLVTWCLTPCIQCSAKKLIYAQTDTNLDYHKEPNRNPEGEAMWRGINLSLSILSPATLQSLSRDAAKILVQAFISSRLDYCNSVLYRVTDNLLQRLQSVQNAAARLMTRTGRRRREHISPVLFCRNCTGCLFDAAWISNWQHQSSSSIEYWLQPTLQCSRHTS